MIIYFFHFVRLYLLFKELKIQIQINLTNLQVPEEM